MLLIEWPVSVNRAVTDCYSFAFGSRDHRINERTDKTVQAPALRARSLTLIEASYFQEKLVGHGSSHRRILSMADGNSRASVLQPDDAHNKV